MDFFNFGCSSATGVSTEDKDIGHLKQVLNSCWDMISQELINVAIDQWSKRLLLIFRLRDGDTGHYFGFICDVCLLQSLFLS